MRFTLLSFLSLIFLLISCNKRYMIPENPQSGILGESIIYLADDKLKGRETGTRGEQMAAEFIVKKYKELGLSPKGLDGTFIQTFEAIDASDPHGHGGDSDMPSDALKVNGRNVVAFLDHGAKNTIVIGAHYDHLGTGGFGSLYEGPAEIHNGADDNASGVAVMLYLAERLKAKKYSESNYLFIAFSGEEKGLWGSNYWTKNPTYNLQEINFMINLDMVGRLKDNKLAINGTGTSPRWSELDNVNREFELVKSESGIGPSDHTSFYLQDIPAIHFFTGQHEDYHKPTDDIEKINYGGCYQISFYILDIINSLQDEKIAFTKTKDESTETPDFKVTLGVIPDYMYNEKGMRIDGVRSGKTASMAGIENGDIVVKMGELEIVDMMSYMKALGKFEPGESTIVVINRDGKLLEKEVTFQ